MRKINQPVIAVSTVFKDCITGVEDTNQRAELTATASLIMQAESQFKSNATAVNLAACAPGIPVGLGGSLSGEVFEDLYTEQMSKSTGSARHHYNRLRAGAKICPYCSHRHVTTLDHFLPKGRYPMLAITPINLVPSCHDCNRTKGTRYPRGGEDQLLHPYYDDMSGAAWLSASLDQGSPLVATFMVNPPTTWPSLDQKRLVFHFENFKLNILYSVAASAVLVEIRPRLLNLYNLGGAGEVKKYLGEESSSKKHMTNFWQQALYLSMAQDPWFHHGGFLNISDKIP